MPPRPHRPAFWLGLILLVQLALGGALIAAAPLWHSHEHDYYAVTRFLIENGRLPTEADAPPGEAAARQITQPPAYFWAAAPIVALLDDGQPVPPPRYPGLLCVGGEFASSSLLPYAPPAADYDPPRGAALAGYGLRLLNLALAAFAVVWTWAAGRLLFPHKPALALTAAALLAFEPTSLRIATTISNDALLLVLAAAALYACARMAAADQLQGRWIVLALGLGAAAVLTRLAGWAVLAFVALTLIVVLARELRRATGPGRVRAQRLALIGAGLFVPALGGLVAFNLAESGSVFGRYAFLDRLVLETATSLNLSAPLIIGVLDHTRLSFLEPFELLRPRAALRTVYVLLPVIGLAGAGAALIAAAARRRGDWLRGLLLPAVLAGLTIGLVLFRNSLNVNASGGVTLYNTAALFAPLRYYAPALPAFALLIAAGWWALSKATAALARPIWPSAARLAALPGIALALLWALVAGLGALALPTRLPPNPALTAEAFAALPHVARFEPPLAAGPTQLHGYRAASRGEDGMVDLVVYASVSAAADSLIAEGGIDDGITALRCQTAPARGFYPTSRWQPGAIMPVAMTIANCAAPLEGGAQLSFRWFAMGDGTLGQPLAEVSLGALATPLSLSATCPPVLGTIAEGYRVTAFHSPPIVRAGEAYLPSANWLVTERSAQVAARAFAFIHIETGAAYLCTDADRAASAWGVGEYVYFDRCPMTFPDDAPAGRYAVSALLLDRDGRPLPAVDGRGEPLPGERVPLGEIIFER